MIRLFKYLILLVIAVALVTVALANRGLMELQLLPDGIASLAGINWTLSFPVFLVILGTFFAGMLFGFVWEWLREHKHRATAKVERRERQRLEREVSKVSPPARDGDDILAILDGR
ncbi:MAG: LapA family protein [Silicimonas sp.]|jgi:uncharacterized integral membrane protein|nr:LapA family protein [Silicimonas sp.]